MKGRFKTLEQLKASGWQERLNALCHPESLGDVVPEMFKFSGNIMDTGVYKDNDRFWAISEQMLLTEEEEVMELLKSYGED